jgi:hypothetical protein
MSGLEAPPPRMKKSWRSSCKCSIWHSYRTRFKQNEEESVDPEGETEDYTVDTSVFESVTCHRDVILKDVKEAPIVKREPKQYNHVVKKTTQFFSTSDLEVLFRILA